jgi:hypothetical protein
VAFFVCREPPSSLGRRATNKKAFVRQHKGLLHFQNTRLGLAKSKRGTSDAFGNSPFRTTQPSSLGEQQTKKPLCVSTKDFCISKTRGWDSPKASEERATLMAIPRSGQFIKLA